MVLQIRQIHINHAIQHAQGIDRFIAGGVPDQRKRRAINVQRAKNLRNKGRGGDEADGFHAHIGQAAQRIRKLCRGEGTACVAVADIRILTISAAERAAAEKYSTGAALAADGRLFPQVGSNAGNTHGFRQAAKPRALLGITPGMALAWAKRAGIHH